VASDQVSIENVAALSPWYLPGSSNANILTADKEDAWSVEEFITI
jgi:hypothetical protein